MIRGISPSYLYFAVIIFAINVGFSFSRFVEKCPEIKLDNSSPTFNPEKLAGMWYPVRGRPNEFRCFQIQLLVNQTHVTYLRNFTYTFENGTEVKIRDKVSHEFSRSTFPFKTRDESCWVLDSNFDGYASFYDCIHFPDHDMETVSIMSRKKRELSEAELKKAYDVYKKFNLGNSTAALDEEVYKRGAECDN